MSLHRRWLSFASAFALSAAVSAGCSVDSSSDGESGDEGATTDDITQVNQSKVERQSIGNCWIYAVTSWLEALNKMATGTELNTSQSHITYWHWFDQLANGSSRTEISTGGSYYTAAELIARYGIMLQKDMIPEEADSEMSSRQSEALKAINESLKSGVLSDPVARRDRETIRRELDKAWRLNPDVVAGYDAVFGAKVGRTLDRVKRMPSGSKIIHPRLLQVKLKDPSTGDWKVGSLADALGTRAGWMYTRSGKFAWSETNYPGSKTGRREFQRRVQRALADGQPVIMSWKVDFNALNKNSEFKVEEIAARGGPGRQGGHMTVLHDYEIDNVPGFGTLKAGTLETRPEALEAALSEEATIKFFRIKNSWGSLRPDRWQNAAIAGYHDLYQTYLDGPIQECDMDEADVHPLLDTCQPGTPWGDAVFPPGY